MTPTAALVTSLAAGQVQGVRVALRARLDGARVADLAAQHQVDALCWWMWKNAVAQDSDARSLELPPPLGDRLRMAYLHHRLRNEALGNDLAVLQDALTARGIEAIFFKGPWMAFHAYPDPGTRPVGDIDLGVREERYRETVETLQAAGWRPLGPVPRTSSEALERSHFRQQLRFSARGRRPVELHFRLLNIGPPREEEQWVRSSSRELQVGPCRLRVPGPEAMLFHLLIHANQHGFAVLRMLHDIRWALDRDRLELDAVKLCRLVRRLRCQAACYHSLRLAEELAGARVESSILDELRPHPARRWLFARAWRLSAVRRLEAPRQRMAVEAPLFYLLEMGRIRDKAGFLARVISEEGGFRTFLREARRLFLKSQLARGEAPR